MNEYVVGDLTITIAFADQGQEQAEEIMFAIYHGWIVLFCFRSSVGFYDASLCEIERINGTKL